MTRTPTLSQSFDIGDFIAPDILSVVDASVRAAAENILDNGGLAGDLERIIDLRADTHYISDASISGLVPSMDPDEFMQYDRPEAPVMVGFDVFETAANPEEPKVESEHTLESTPNPEVEPVALKITYINPVDIEIRIPDLGTIEQTATMVQEDIVFELPEVSRFNANLFKVRLDTLRFDEKLKVRVRLIILIAVIVVVEALLIIYLLTT